MRATKIVISQYRSIEHVDLTIPEGKPLVLFGPNNAGKSNIISAISRILGERYAPYVEMQDSDFFMRDKDKYPNSWIGCHFDTPYYYNRSSGNACYECYVKYDKELSKNCYCDSSGKKCMSQMTTEERFKRIWLMPKGVLTTNLAIQASIRY